MRLLLFISESKRLVDVQRMVMVVSNYHDFIEMLKARLTDMVDQRLAYVSPAVFGSGVDDLAPANAVFKI